MKNQKQLLGCEQNSGIDETFVRNEFWSYGGYELVGHGKQTNAECGKFKRFDGCLNVEAHNAARWFTTDLAKDSVYVRSVYHSCDKPTCPVCFKFGWAVRQASARLIRRDAALSLLTSRVLGSFQVLRG